MCVFVWLLNIKHILRWHVPVFVWGREEHDDLFCFSLTLSFSAFQRHNGEILTAASVKHLSHWRFVVSFQLDSVQRADQDLYRCVTQSPRGSGVSNFAELVVKGKYSLLFLSYCCLPPSCVFSFPTISFSAVDVIIGFSALLGHSRLLRVIQIGAENEIDPNKQW